MCRHSYIIVIKNIASPLLFIHYITCLLSAAPGYPRIIIHIEVSYAFRRLAKACCTALG